MAHEGEAGSREARHTGEAGGGAELDLGLPRGGEALLARGGAEELGAGETRRRSELERGAEEAGALGARARAATPSWRERRSWTGLRVDFVEVRGFFCKTSGKRTIWAIRSSDQTAGSGWRRGTLPGQGIGQES